MDPLSIVADEVTLEGLDGITIPSLWIRLEGRQPKFPLKLDDCTKELIWKSLIHNTDLKFYQLPKERPDVVLQDRFKDIDIETAKSSSDAPKDIYPIHIIENRDGIQGSCEFFKQRTDVTKNLRSKSLTPLVGLNEALDSYGRKLVAVASQNSRFRTLIGSESDPDLKLSDDSYCLLERVGRGRWQGELQKDLHGHLFNIDARKLHYLRKSLVKHGLVSMQSHCTRLKTGQQQHSILLLLKRFHVNRRSKYDILMEQLSNLLQQLPERFATLATVREQMNLNECNLKRVVYYMRSAKLVDYCQFPLEDLDPGAGPCVNKKGNKVMVRCLKLLKPYIRKDVAAADDDDEDEEEDDDTRDRPPHPSGGRIMERDVLSQAYQLVLACGTKGIPQRSIGATMNVGKLESRMICRKLERDGVIKGFMVDEGRQRTTKFISHKCVGVSDQLQMFAKEQERNKLLISATPQKDAAPKALSGAKENGKAAAAKKKEKGNARGGGSKEEAGALLGDGSDEPEQKEKIKSGAKRNTPGKKGTKQTEPVVPAVEPTAAEGEEPAAGSSSSTEAPEPESLSKAEQAPVEEGDDSSSGPTGALPQPEAPANLPGNNLVEVKDGLMDCKYEKGRKSHEKNRETYRLLRRKNLIVEAVHNFKIIEGLFPLQKMINDEEKQDGFSSKCCKKTILRLIHSLSREGLLKLYTTVVVQDGITKKVELVVHPSIQPNDDIVHRTIEQVRFKIASSYTAIRLQHAEEKAREQLQRSQTGCSSKEDDFKPNPVRGLGKKLGFQPKMPRMRVIHTFLWYLIYGHPEKQAADSTLPNLDATSGDEEEELKDGSNPARSQSNMKVYADENSWKRFVPPVRAHKEFGSGWAMVGDLLCCLPLSVFIQVTQINYKVDGLEEYLSDPVKQHHLVRALPARMRRQLLYKRKYIFTFHENLQKLVYMGLLHFGPMEKFKEKDQVFLYLKRNISIVDTTSAEPHYWLVTESPEKPFEKRQYSFNTTEDIENYWFDLMCVCLNTPLGVVRSKRYEEGTDPSFVHERNVFVGLAHMLKGSREVCDDGRIPGDGKGAGGLDSEFFAHLKRNWFWTNHLLSNKKPPTGLEAKETKVRLKSLLSKDALRIALKAGGTTAPRYVTVKRPLIENVEVVMEPASRNQQVVGGKGQKRKRQKKEVVKAPRKKKREPKKRTPAHDEADHKALKMMTRQRVYWSIQEDSLMMLCSVASHLMNSKLKRPFIPYCVVRDLLHSEFEISVDKTSVAVGRRTRYILKNPQTLLNYRICLAEVYQDKPLMEQLEKKKPASPDNPEDCSQVFSEYVRLLRQKFSSALIPCDTVMPDSKHQLFSRFRVSAIQNGKQFSCSDAINSTDDIHALVLHNLIQSTLAMTNGQMKSSRSFQTFQLYSKYNQELLCQVFIQCRKRGLVNRRRVNQPFGPKKNRALPILPMSYQLSQSYYRCFSTRFPHSLCTDAFRFLKCLIGSAAADAKPVTAFHHETEHRSEGGEQVAPDRKRKRSKGKEASGVEKKNADSAKEGEPVKEEEEDGPSRAKPPATEEPPDVSDMLPFTLDSPGGACVVSLSLMCLGLLNVFISIPKQIVVVDSSLVDNDVVKSMAAALEEEEEDDEDGGEECDGRKRLEVKSHQASHTNYLMMRGYCSPGIVKRRDLNTTDNIVVESCMMRLQLRSTPAHTVLPTENVPPLDLCKCGPSLLPPSLTSCTRSAGAPAVDEYEGRLVELRGYSPQDVEACARLTRSLDATGERGLDIRDFYQAHGELEEPGSGRSRSLDQYVKDLEEEGVLLQVGSLGVRLVLRRHAEPWLLVVKSKPWSQSHLTADTLKKSCIFTRKRCRRHVPKEPEEPEEPPGKKATVDRPEDEDAEMLPPPADVTGGKLNEEEQPKKDEGGGKGSGDKVIDLEEAEAKEAELEGKRKEEEGKEAELLDGEDSIDGERAGSERTAPTEAAGDDDDEHLTFISRPWRMVDGSVNRPVCKGMLEAILFHVMARPGLTQQTMVEHYKDVLQPTSVLDLLQVLIEMGCLKKRTLVKLPKSSLFSRPAQPTKSETQAKVEDPDTVFYEPTISCCLRLSQVLPNERHWNYCIP